jgi:L-threonylcarbamoyladenylate synthase
MKTLIFPLSKNSPDPNVIEKAASIIRSGGLVAFPTETVYGLGADALNENAVKKIFQAKNRPADNPIIIHISDKSMLSSLVSTITPLQQRLIDAFWPGPLTILFEKSDKVSDLLTGGLPTVTIRMPSHEVARQLILTSHTPIAAPSANTSGKPSPTKASHVREDLDGKIEMILDSGATHFGVESTVINPLTNPSQILRLGAISVEEISAVVPDVIESSQSSIQPASPGMKYRHYAPKARVIIIDSISKDETLHKILNESSISIKDAGFIVSTLGTKLPIDTYTYISNEDLSQNLFDFFRSFDKQNKKLIFVEKPINIGLGKTILDRLQKASA